MLLRLPVVFTMDGLQMKIAVLMRYEKTVRCTGFTRQQQVVGATAHHLILNAGTKLTTSPRPVETQ